MAVRTGYVGTQVAGDVLTAANFSKLPGGWLGYVEVTADQTGITTEVDLTSLTLAVTVGTSRRIKITGSVMAQSTIAGDAVVLQIKEGGTYLQAVQNNTPVAGQPMVFERSVVLTPTAGAHTYKLALARASGTGTISMRASATFPAWIDVVDIGPAS